jgi:hypothetical protein
MLYVFLKRVVNARIPLFYMQEIVKMFMCFLYIVVVRMILEQCIQKFGWEPLG